MRPRTYYVWVGCVCMCLIIYLSVAIRLKQFAFNPPPRARAYCLCPWLLALVLRVGHRGVPWPRLWRGLPALRRAGLRLRCPGGVSFGGTLPCSASPASEVCALRVVRPWPAFAVAWALVLAAGAKRWWCRACSYWAEPRPAFGLRILGGPCASWCGWLKHTTAKVVHRGDFLSAWRALLRGFAVQMSLTQTPSRPIPLT